MLYQDARWPGSARLMYGAFVAPLWVLAAVRVLAGGVSVSAGVVTSVILALPVVACEWRARRMGIIVSDAELILVRPLNRTHIAWSEINDFKTVPFGAWGEARLRVERRGHFRSKLAIPTLVLTPSRSWWTWWFQPAMLRGASGEVVDPLVFLRDRQRAAAATLPLGRRPVREGGRDRQR